MNEVSKIYDNLFNFEAKRKNEAYPIHKRLNLSMKYPDLVDWIMSKVEFNEADNILDAGCGTGYSLIKLANEKGVSGIGISISENEIDYAQNQLKIHNIENQISFEKMSYDLPLSGKYDKILAIESLKHSVNLEMTLNNLCKSLAANGTLIIADDFSSKSGSKLFKEHIKLWNAQSYFSKEFLIKAMAGIGDFKIYSFDLTDKVPVRSHVKLRMYIFLTRLLILLSLGSWKRNMKTYLGGLFLEMLYLKKQVNYMVFLLN